DALEIEHGFDCVNSAYKGQSGEKFKSVLNNLHPGFCGELEESFNKWLPYFRNDTYLTCISEHHGSEDTIGRLSMWRAYGGNSGVAIVVNGAAFTQESSALATYTSPVSYLSRDQFARHLGQIASAMEASNELLSTLPKDDLMGHIFHMLRFSVLCTKHPGFHEEREWRLIHCPTFEKSERMIRSVETIRGTPQIVYKLPLQNAPEENLTGIDIPEFIDRIIIGPTLYPEATHAAFILLLHEAGVQNPHSKVFMSDVPLRVAV
ncbi:MAG TPA: DUF2971 domain-containing protein, partial [Reyranella sp.]|nr:DUF2971 domain-containing protein [Reyranella sp.]